MPFKGLNMKHTVVVFQGSNSETNRWKKHYILFIYVSGSEIWNYLWYPKHPWRKKHDHVENGNWPHWPALVNKKKCLKRKGNAGHC